MYKKQKGGRTLQRTDNYIEKAEIIAKESTHISLAGETDFYESFIKNINFAK